MFLKNQYLDLYIFSFTNDLPHDIESKIKVFTDYVKLRIRPISKEKIEIDRNKLSYREYIC